MIRLFLGRCGLVTALWVGVHSAAVAQPPADEELRPEAPQAAAEALSPAPSVAHLFQQTLGDFRRLPSWDTLLWLGLGGAAATIGHTQDASIANHFSESGGLNDVLVSGQTIGGMPFQLGGALAAYTLGRVTRKPRVTELGAELLQAHAVAQAMTWSVKVSVRRTRPDGEPRSFPSGHATTTFASATVLQRRFGWKVGIPAYGVASYVAASRVQMKRHYLSDVVFGAALGIVAGRSVRIGRGNARFQAAPVPVNGGAGIAFAWVGQQ